MAQEASERTAAYYEALAAQDRQTELLNTWERTGVKPDSFASAKMYADTAIENLKRIAYGE